MSRSTVEDRSAGRRARTRRLVGFAVGLLILGFLVVGVVSGWGEVTSYQWHLDAPLFVGGIALLLAFYMAGGLGYVLVVERLHGNRLASRWAVYSVWARSLLGRYVPGTVVMIAGRVTMGRRAGVSGRVTLAASVYEQILLLTTAIFASLFFLAAYEGPGSVSWVLLLAAAIVGLVIVHPRVLRRWSTWLLDRLGRDPLEIFLSERQLVALLAYYAVASSVAGLGVSLLVRSAVGDGAGDVAYVGLAFLLSLVAGMLAFIVPSGLGVRDALFAVALARYLPDDVALAVAAGVRLVVTAVELGLIAVVASAPWLGARLRRRSSAST